jgi:pyruvate,water dikinase
MMFPEIKWMAKMVPWIENAKHYEGKIIQGTATSAGKYTGVARVIYTPAEFPLLKQGEILVAVTTTPAWTPLFNRCATIVTDIGGPLSHSSIIAREYGLPAVVATGNATRRILSGMVITVDGDTGKIHLP